MKRILVTFALAFASLLAGAQTFIANNLQVNGSAVLSGNISGSGTTNLFASPPAVGASAPNAGSFTTLSGSSLNLGLGSITAGIINPNAANTVNRSLYGKIGDDLTIKDFGAKEDGQAIIGNVTTVSGTAALTLSTGVFTSADVGKIIIVPGSGATGHALVTTIASFTSATQVTLTANAGTSQTAVSQTVTYGTNDTSAVQLAVNNTCNGCTLRFPNGITILNAAIQLPRPIQIQGPGNGSYINHIGAAVVQSNTAANAFTMVASLSNWAFSQYGILNMVFKDITIEGPSDNTLAQNGIGVDTTVNGGVFHIRNNLLENVTVKDFVAGVNYTGIAYLNDFIGGTYSRCTTGLLFAQGSSGTAGGQTRFFGVQVDFNTTGISFFEDTQGGDLSVFGSTVADGTYGIRANQYADLNIEGSHFESLTNGNPGVLAGGSAIYIPISINANPASATSRVIQGNHFLSNDNDIVINKTSTGFAGGGFAFPMRVDANYFGDASALLIIVPGGHAALDSNMFVWGASNSGPSGAVASSAISANFNGTFEANRRVTKRFVITAAYASGTVLWYYPNGFVPLSVRIYLTANSSAFTSCTLGDSGNSARYIAAFNANSQALNTWLNWTPPVPQFTMAGGGTSNNPQLICTAGTLSLAGVVEIDGYQP